MTRYLIVAALSLSVGTAAVLGGASRAAAQATPAADQVPPAVEPTPVVDPEAAPAPEATEEEAAAPAESETPAPASEPAGAPAATPEPTAAPAPAAVAAPPPAAVAAPPPAATPPWGLELAGVMFRPSIEVRSRGELRTGGYVGEPDQGLVTTRARIGLDARWELLRAFVQLQDARDFGVFPGTSSGATTGIHQGYMELGDGTSWVRGGRQEIEYGSGRLIGALNWASAARSFDALRVRTQQGEFTIDGFGAVVRTPRSLTRPDGTARSSEGDYLGALALEWSPGAALRLGGYFLYRHDGPTEAPVGTDPMLMGQWLDRHRDISAGSLRASGIIERQFRYELEMVLQGGEVNGNDHLAAGLIGEAHYRFDVPWSPEIGLGGTFGTGQSPDGSWDEFDNFYPTNHLIYGLIDLFGLRNQTHGFARFGLTPIANELSVWTAGRVFRFNEPGARWTNAGGQVVGVNAMNTDEFAGVEVDLEARWTPMRFFSLWAGYSAFIPGGGAANLGHPDPMHWGYLMVGVNAP